MKTTNLKKVLSVLLITLLIAASALIISGCNDNTTSSDFVASADYAIELGEGSTSFNFSVFDIEGKETLFLIKTDKKTVGEALLENKLIAGEESQYGLYVKTVNEITLDYNSDGYYWSFYINGKYAISGVDSTEIAPNTTYSFKAEKS